MEFLDKGGVPLGIMASAVYETGTVSLRSGDTLIMFTDGVVEAFNAAGEEFGNGRWLNAIRRLPPGTASQNLAFLMGRLTSLSERHGNRTTSPVSFFSANKDAG